MKKQTTLILKHLGFTEYETRAYLALLNKKYSSASEVAELSGIPQNLIYKTLDGVGHKGGCVIIKDTKKRYEPTDPDVLLANAQAKLEADVADLKKNVASVKGQLKHIYENQLAADDDIDYVKFYKHPLIAAAKFSELLAAVETESLVFSTNRHFEKSSKEIDEEMFAEQLKKESIIMLKNINEKGAKYRVITTLEDISPILISKGVSKYFFDCDGFDMRIVDKVPLKASIFGGKDILLSLRNLRDTGYSDVMIHIRDSRLAAELRDSFYRYYNEGISLKELDLDILANEKRIVKKR